MKDLMKFEKVDLGPPPTLPDTRRHARSLTNAMDSLQIGESLLVKGKSESSIRSIAGRLRRENTDGRKYTVHKFANGDVGVWRTA